MNSLTQHDILSKLSGALDRASNGRARLEQICDDAKLIEDIGLSSLDLLDLRCEIEEIWQTKVADEELRRFARLGISSNWSSGPKKQRLDKNNTPQLIAVHLSF